MLDRTTCSDSVGRIQTNLTGGPADQLELLQATYGERAGFRAAVFDGKKAWVVVDPGTLGDWKVVGSREGVPIAASCVDESLIDAGLRVAQSPAATGSTISGYDALTDSVFVEGSTDVESLADAVVNALGRGSARTVVDKARNGRTLRLTADAVAPALVGRFNDSPAYFGGGRTRTDTQDGFIHLCTTGIYLSSTTFGTVMATAGHCSSGLNGKPVRNGDNSRSVGTTEGAHFPNPDLELIDGQSYAATTFSGNNSTSISTVTGSTMPSTGVTYCQYGATSLIRCYAYISLDTTVCDSPGVNCTQHLAYTQGPSGRNGSLASGGDSGAGVFREITATTVSARGIKVRGSCTATMCNTADHKIETVLTLYNAFVVQQ